MVQEALVLPSANKIYVRSGHRQCRQRGFPHPPCPGTRVEVVYEHKKLLSVCPGCVSYQHYLPGSL